MKKEKKKSESSTSDKTNKPTGISLPEDLLLAADKRAKSLYLNRSQYIRQLIISDTKLITVDNNDRTKEGK